MIPALFWCHFLCYDYIYVLYSIINNNRNDLIDVVSTVFSFVYTSILYMHFILIRFLPLGRHYVWWIFVMTWACDTGAFFTGKLFGKRKLPQPSVHTKLSKAVQEVFC